jgi:hypothetical protein
MEILGTIASMQQVLEDKSSSSYSTLEKSIIIERTIQNIKYRTNGCFDDYFPCRKKKYKLKHVTMV